MTEHRVEDRADREADRLRDQALGLLDFDAVRHRVAGYTTFGPARRLALELSPSYRRAEVEELQRETAEGRLILDHVGDVSLRLDADASAEVTRAGLGGVLTGLDLLRVAESLEVQRRARAGVANASLPVPLLSAIVRDIPDLDELRRQITSRLGLRGEVLDTAAPNLGAIRSRVRGAYDEVTQALNAMVQSPTVQGALQDNVISVRSDRFVVQVKSEMRHRVPGVVHGASNTGATLFVEPFSIVNLSNRWRELVLEEDREVRRVLTELSSLVGTLADDIVRGNERTGALDLVLARARYAIEIGGEPVPPQRDDRSTASSDTVAHVRLLNARHPLLGPGTVPVNVTIGPGWCVLVVTGPNTGGKTVAMKTMGLLALMHQSGLQIPAGPGSSLPVFDGIYADIGDQQSIERSASTFSSHMRNVIEILAQAGPASLVLLDEIGTSTDPEEGSALAKSVLEHLAGRGVATVATTHHRTVAAFAASAPGMTNASVQLDPETLAPTYHLTMGVPGRSYAMSVAEHMGLSEEIMQRARDLLEPQHMRFEDWLNELQRERTQLQTRLQEAEQSLAQAESMRRDVEAEREYLASRREELVGEMRRELLAQYEEVRQRLGRTRAALSWSVPPRDLKGVEREVSSLKAELDAPVWKPTLPPAGEDEGPIGVDDVVHVKGLNLRGTVVSLDEQTGDVEVNVGSVRLRLDLSRISKSEQGPVVEQPGVSFRLGPGLTTGDLDIRGLRAEEARLKLEEFLDRAVRDGYSSIRVIHGRGTGVLKNVVREQLSLHPLARSFDDEAPQRGGAGVTTVELA
jgi:DNA mismatch repair protein MutS2